MIDDPYETPYLPVPIGEHCITIHEDGHVTNRRKEPDEHSSIWKNARKILSCSDDAIELLGKRANGIEDYKILNAGVSWRGLGHGVKRQWFCGTHRVNNCPHTRRMQRYREEHAK